MRQETARAMSPLEERKYIYARADLQYQLVSGHWQTESSSEPRMRILLLGAILLVSAITLAETQVVFRPHFVYKQKQAEKAEKAKRRQEVLAQQTAQPEYYDPYYYHYYQNQGQQPNYSTNYYRPQFFQYQPRSQRDERSARLDHLLRKYKILPLKNRV